MTLQEAKKTVKDYGYVLWYSFAYDEYQIVDYSNRDNDYFTADRDDAVSTAVMMSAYRDIKIGSEYVSPSGVSCTPTAIRFGAVSVKYYGANFVFSENVSIPDFRTYRLINGEAR